MQVCLAHALIVSCPLTPQQQLVQSIKSLALFSNASTPLRLHLFTALEYAPAVLRLLKLLDVAIAQCMPHVSYRVHEVHER